MMKWTTILVFLGGGALHAANDLYWDTNGTADGSGAATGTWGTSLFWNTDVAGVANAFQSSTNNSNDLHFSAGTNGATGTITVNGAQSASGIYFEEGNVTISGGTSITLSNGAVINSVTGSSVIPTISTALVASGTVTISGTRIWLNNPSFAGGGTLEISSSGATLLENSGALNGLSTINMNSGGLDIRVNTSGTNYNYAAGTTLNFLSNTPLTTNFGSSSVNWLGNITIAASRTATLGASVVNTLLTVSGNISGAGAVSVGGAGILVLTGSNTYTGITTVGQGVLRISGGSALANPAVVSMGTGAGANTLDMQSSETIGALSGGNSASSVVNLASGQTLSLSSGTQSYSGTFSGDGTLAVTGAVQTLASAVTLSTVSVSSGALNVSAAGTLTNASISGGTLVLTGGSTLTNGLAMTGGTFQAGTARGSSLTVPNNITVSAGTRATLGPVATGTSGTATVSFGGTLTLNSGGFLQLGAPGTNAAYGTANGAVVFGAGAAAGTKFQLNGNSFTIAGLGTDAGAPGSAVVENGSSTAITLTVALPASGASTYAGTLRNGGTGTLSLTVNGGTGSALTLAGANTFTGSTSLTGGSLILAHRLALQNTTVTTGGTGIIFDSTVASHSFSLGGLSGSTDLSLQDTGGNAVTLSVGGNNSTQTYTGIFSGTGGLTKTGSGQFSLSAASTYTGATTVNGGELRVDFSLAGAPLDNIISSSSALVLGGGILTERQVVNTNPNRQTFNGLTVKAGSSAVNQIRAGSGVLLLTLGSVTRETGGTVNFSANGGGTSGIAATGTNTASGIIGGWATYFTTNGGATLTNGIDWASYSSGKIIAYTGSYTNTAATTAATNLDLTASVALNTDVTVGSVRFNNAIISPTLTLNGTHIVGSGGILVTGNVGANATRITGGTITSGNGQDLIIIQNNTNASGALTVDATISGAVGLTKSGAGQLILSGTNTYTGATYLNGGVTSISSNANLGSATTGAAVRLNGGTLSATATLALDNAGSNARAVILDNNGGTLDVASGQTLTVSGAVSGEGALSKTGAGVLALTGTSTQTGTTTVSAGTLQVSGQTGSGALVLNGTGVVLSGSGMIQGTTTVTTGTIRPGDALGTSIGTLTTGELIFTPATATTVAELQLTGSTSAGTLASDRISISGALTLNGSSNTAVTGTAYIPTLGDSFVLVDWSTLLDTGTSSVFNTGTNFRTGANIGNEGNLDLPDLSSFSLGWEVINFSGSGSLTIVVVPEPGRMLLVFFGLTALSWRRRRC